jgi:RNA polymerase sporulation-specific sigma factor
MFLYNKVEICGINTSSLRVLPEEEKTQLLRRSLNGDKAARERLIQGNLRLVLSVVQRFSQRNENPDDLFQVGCIGLIKAIDHFDITQNVRFSTYAVPMIIGEIRRYLRDNSSVRISRSLRNIAYKAIQAREQLVAENGREPTDTDLARVLGVSREQIVQAMEAIADPISIYEPVYSDGGDTLYIMDQLSDGGNEENLLDELTFKEALRSLGERERKILHLRFFRGMTQMEVSAEIGISQAQVSRLEKSALNHVKGQL